MQLVPAVGDWIATWRATHEVMIYVDVTDAPRRDRDAIRAIDLDLDVLYWRDGRVTIDDEDEFE
ncbi:MAG TPA: DUF402 domain-containing protein [Sporichthyaceae bacterium]|nr:DUF402 domain-containing protein [Sporichthyaceae bacterium]